MAALEGEHVAGMSTENIRLLVNELVRRYAPNGTYVEVGTFQGCSLLSAALFNPSTSCIGVDNFSQFDQDGKNEQILKENLARFPDCANITFYNQDYKEWFQRTFPGLSSHVIDVYFYDGSHAYENQYEGLQAALPFLAEKCIILVDDINIGFTAKANRDFIKKNPDFKSVFRIRTRANGSADWWNGFEIIARGF